MLPTDDRARSADPDARSDRRRRRRRSVALAPTRARRSSRRAPSSIAPPPATRRSTASTPASARSRRRASPRADLDALQMNLVRSHAAGVGEPLPVRAVRASMALRANVLAKGYSGVRVETLDALLALLNAGVHPHVPSRGSVGASGDLAPLAHIALALVGEGDVWDGAARGPAGRARCARPASRRCARRPRKAWRWSTAPRPLPPCWRWPWPPRPVWPAPPTSSPR